MDRGTLLVVLAKRLKACLRSLAGKLRRKERSPQGVCGPVQAAEMGIRVFDLQRLVPNERDTVGPRKPVWALEKPLRPAGFCGEAFLRKRGAKGAVQAVPPRGDQCS